MRKKIVILVIVILFAASSICAIGYPGDGGNLNEETHKNPTKDLQGREELLASPTEEWSKAYDSGLDENASAVAVDSSGSVIVTGKSVAPDDDNDSLTVKYDSSGNELWSMRYDGGHNDSGAAVAVDSQDNVIVTGYSEREYYYMGYYRMLLPEFITIKYDSSGNQLWAKNWSYGGFNQSTSYGVGVDSNDDIIVGGWTTDPDGSGMLAHIKKYDSSGNEVWSTDKGFGYEGVFGYDLTLDSSENILLTGAAYTNLTSDGEYYDPAILAAKLDSTGSEEWNNTYDPNQGTLDYYGLGIARDSSDDVYVCGWENEQNSTYYNHTSSDWRIVKFSGTDGSNLGAISYDGEGDADWAAGVAVDSADNVIVTGASTLSGDKDYYTARVTISGGIEADLIYDGGNYDAANEVTFDSNDNTIVTGGSELSGDFDYYTIKYGSWDGGSSNTPPDSPTNPDPTDGETGVLTDVTLSVDVSDPDGDSLNVSFYNASDDSLIGTDTNVNSGSRASVDWLNLAKNSDYSWYTVSDDGMNTTQSDTWIFHTVLPSMDISLSSGGSEEGWNFVSYNLINQTNELETLLNWSDYGIRGNYDKVMYYDASQDDWQTFSPYRGKHYNNIGTWNREMGLWIHMESDDTLTINGSRPSSTTITLQPGWNMVGYPSSTDRTASDTLPAEATKIGVFNASREYNLQYIYDLTKVTMKAGNGYWVYNSADSSVDWGVGY